jgi:hypothetical protein
MVGRRSLIRQASRPLQVITASVVYKPDGSVDRYDEQTRYEPGK